MKPFINTAQDIRRGQFLEDCGDKLHEVVASVAETGKAAKLTIEITVKPASKGQGAVIISDKIRSKLPELPAGETILFVTPENNLQATDPNQGSLDLRDVSNPNAPVRTVAA